MRETDGASRTVVYEAGTRPGAYRPTPPDFTPALFSHWGTVTPFALKTAAQFRPTAPPEPGSALALTEIATVAAHRRVDEHDAHGGADRDLEVLVRELDPGLESHRP